MKVFYNALFVAAAESVGGFAGVLRFSEIKIFPNTMLERGATVFARTAMMGSDMRLPSSFSLKTATDKYKIWGYSTKLQDTTENLT